MRATIHFCAATTDCIVLSSGITAPEHDNINCDQAEEVGSNVMKKFDNITFTDVAVKRSNQACTLSDVTLNAVSGDK